MPRDLALPLIFRIAPIILAGSPHPFELPGEQCQARDAVYLQAASGAQQGISLYFVCCQCQNT